MNVQRTLVASAIAAAFAVAALPVAAQTKKAPPAPKAEAQPAAPTPDQADLDRSQIIGNRELPKVTYIVPWKKPGAGDLSGRPLVSVLDEALAPLDREVFRRQTRYDAQAVQQQKDAAQAAAAPAPAK